MKVDRNNIRVHVAKASMELRSGRINEARATLRHATALQSEDGVHYTMWATLEIDSGNFREARRLLEEGAEKFPGDQFLLQRWGALESKFGSVRKARELFDRSIVIQPHAPTFVAWAILEEDQGILVRQSLVLYVYCFMSCPSFLKWRYSHVPVSIADAVCVVHAIVQNL